MGSSFFQIDYEEFCERQNADTDEDKKNNNNAFFNYIQSRYYRAPEVLLGIFPFIITYIIYFILYYIILYYILY
jgi:hypothetical protein